MNRPSRKAIKIVSMLGLLILANSHPLSAQKSRPLFNGKNLEGWQQAGPGQFVVKDGAMKTEGGMGILWYIREKISRATIRVVFRLTSKDSDSGVFIRIPEKPSEPWMPINRGYEVEIGDWPDDYSCTGVLYTFTKALARPIRSIGEWNTMEITIDGPRTIVYRIRGVLPGSIDNAIASMIARYLDLVSCSVT